MPNDIDLNPIQRLTRDLRAASVTLSDREARYLVDSYYIMQEARKRGYNQERALGASGEPHEIITWFAQQSETLEKEITKALNGYTDTHLMGPWMKNIHGIGPIISAGLLAHLYMGDWCAICHGRNLEDCKYRQERKKNPVPRHTWQSEFSLSTAGRIYQFAGIAGDGQHEWKPKELRPWNQSLKTLCWKIGDSFVKNSGVEKCYYGHYHYRQRKAQEVANNESGKYKHIAEARIARDKQRGKVSVESAPYHQKGILSPGHIDLRARRYAVKIFLSHLHAEWYYRVKGEKAPAPYPIAFLGHADYIPPPNAAE